MISLTQTKQNDRQKAKKDLSHPAISISSLFIVI